jgi:hypothetical protein
MLTLKSSILALPKKMAKFGLGSNAAIAGRPNFSFWWGSPGGKSSHGRAIENEFGGARMEPSHTRLVYGPRGIYRWISNLRLHSLRISRKQSGVINMIIDHVRNLDGTKRRRQTLT